MLLKTSNEAKDKDTFSRLAHIASWVGGAGFLFQVISALTEANGIYQFGTQITGNVWLIGFFTLAIVVAWEKVIRAGTMYSTRTITGWCTGKIPFKPLEVPLLAIGMIIAGLLAWYSFSVSKENSHMTFIMAMPEEDTSQDSTIHTGQDLQLSELSRSYSAKRHEIQTRYRELISAKKAEYDGKMYAPRTEIDYWQKMERTKGKKYTSTIKKYKQRVNDLIAEKNAAVANLTEQRNGELSTLTTLLQQEEDAVKGMARTDLSRADKARAQYEAWFEKYSHIWSWFAGYSVVLAILCMVFVQLFKSLADIEEASEASAEYYEPSLLSEVGYLFQVGPQRWLRNRVRNWINSMENSRVQLSIQPAQRVVVQPIQPVVQHQSRPPHRGPVVQGARGPVVQPTGVVQPVSTTVAQPPRTTVVQPRTTASAQPVQPQLSTTVVQPQTVVQGNTVAQVQPAVQPDAKVVQMAPVVHAQKPQKLQPLDDEKRVVEIKLYKGEIVAILAQDGQEPEQVTIRQVQSRKSAQKSKMKKAKGEEAISNAQRWIDFYQGLEDEMKGLRDK